MEAVDRALREMMTVSEYDEELSSLTDSLSTISDLLTDFSRETRLYLEEHTFSEAEFQMLEERLNTVNHLKAKYGKTIPDIFAYQEQLQSRLEQLEHQEEYLEKLNIQLTQIEQNLKAACQVLTHKRKTI